MVVRPERFELPTAWFVARYSIQLSYGRKEGGDYRDINSWCQPRFSAEKKLGHWPTTRINPLGASQIKKIKGLEVSLGGERGIRTLDGI